MKVFMTVFMKLNLHGGAMNSPTTTRQLLRERRFPGSYGQGGNQAEVHASHLLRQSATPERRVAAALRFGEYDARGVDARCEQATVTLSQSMVEVLWLTNSRGPLISETMYRFRTGNRAPVDLSLLRLEQLLDHLDRQL
jgi:hypothetical protein